VFADADCVCSYLTLARNPSAYSKITHDTDDPSNYADDLLVAIAGPKVLVIIIQERIDALRPR
jgi:hypothetical protein